MNQRGEGVGDFFRNIVRPTAKIVGKEVKGIAKRVGSEVAGNVLTDVIAGKSAKEAIKSRGRQAKGLVAQQALNTVLRQRGKGNLGSDMGWSRKTAKRSSSGSKPPAKRKRKAKQKGGSIFPSYAFDPYEQARIMRGGKTRKGKKTQKRKQSGKGRKKQGKGRKKTNRKGT